ncbi:5937_t:CDS:10 [Funneliformis mosseae]|uniref:5937_t:CDS:1 n=1 Tax=Funneliformis mosseae TaxID=27381 RepID=A0A9N9CD67_FUNMO|nr:5937_t:CDS:10 [Funneliformis mosseae]
MGKPIPTLKTFEIVVSPEGVAILTLNRPERANSLNNELLQDWIRSIEWATEAEQVKVVVVTGKGNFFCSGLELSEISNEEELKRIAEKCVNLFRQLVDLLIDFPKLLIAAVNGKAFGFGVTFLPHCDVVYSVPEATFLTPFMQWAFCVEGCSSYLFPKYLGQSIASEMLLMNKTYAAPELAKVGFISRLIPKDHLIQETLKEATRVSKFSFEAIIKSKKLIRRNEREFLHKINQRENELLLSRLVSEDSRQAVLTFLISVIRNLSGLSDSFNKSFSNKMFSTVHHTLLNQPAPTNLALKNQGGELVELKSLVGNGKPSVIFFYPKDESYGCTKEVCSFRDSYSVFSDAGATVVGISSDPVDKHKQFSDSQRLQFPLLSDPNNEARKLFNVPKTLGFLPGRATFLIDKDGIIRDVFNSMMDFEGHVKKSLEFVKNQNTQPKM